MFPDNNHSVLFNVVCAESSFGYQMKWVFQIIKLRVTELGREQGNKSHQMLGRGNETKSLMDVFIGILIPINSK
jgi:hypothetical protein